jgi:hypothetical protein
MVQIQSSWFPLYDRNPQTFVSNIFWAKPDEFQKAVQRVYHEPDKASFIELPIVTADSQVKGQLGATSPGEREGEVRTLERERIVN